MIINSMNDIAVINSTLRDTCLNKGHTKSVIYRTIVNENPAVHPVYLNKRSVPDYQRVSFTRLRFTSHSLISDKGSWSRTPPNQRVSPCDHTSIQDEHDALLNNFKCLILLLRNEWQP